MVVSIVNGFDDLSLFWRFLAPKILYWWYDDLWPYFEKKLIQLKNKIMNAN